MKDGQDRFKIYAEQTLSAIQCVTAEFEGLSLHDRFALIVPNNEFRASLLPVLHAELSKAYTKRSFKLVTAEEASGLMGSGSEGARQVDGAEWIVLDEISQMDGLERLIVVGVGLDNAMDDTASDNSETRSMLYRAMTRAHMMVLVVNEFIPGGWFGFLTNCKLDETMKFDAERAKQAAEEQAAKTREAQEKAIARQKELDKQTEAAMAGASVEQKTAIEELKPEDAVLVKPVVRAELQKGATATQAVAKGIIEAQRPGQAQAAMDASQEMKSSSADADFVRKYMVESLKKGTSEDTALSSALVAWELKRKVGQIPEVLQAKLTNADKDTVMEASLKATIETLVKQGVALDAAVASALGQWAELREAITDKAQVVAKEIKPSDIVLLQTKAAVSITRGTPLDKAVDGQIRQWILVEDTAEMHAQLHVVAKDRAISVTRACAASLESTSAAKLKRGATADEAVETTLAEWIEVERAVAAEVGAKEIAKRDLAELQIKAAAAVLQGKAVNAAVLDIVSAWTDTSTGKRPTYF
eukprot:SAG25_NODE_707_length_5832_cov_4.564800_2_plen_530_part_00